MRFRFAKNAVAIAVIAVAAAIPSFAQSTVELSNHQLGLTASSISGMGLYYQYIFSEALRLQLAGFVAYTNDENEEDLTSIVGLELQQTVQRSKDSRFYFLGGLHYWYEECLYTNNYLDRFGNPIVSETRYVDERFTIGAGAGFELMLMDHLAGGLQLGLQYSNEDGGTRKRFGVGGGISVGYRI